ncbi:MAG TPA: TolC family protein [Gemmatimonadales bacterium]|nr:TolC family protein [Gemmatimonadales bacterium]HRX19134.1 TolC family protein [Gemmatimonadales bacterium]
MTSPGDTARLSLALALSLAAPLPAQQADGPAPLTRAEARALARDHAPLLPVAAADTLAGAAAALDGRLRNDPSLAASWTKSVPRGHLEVTWPLDVAGIRGATRRAGDARREASDARWQAALAEAVLGADTTYTRAAAARERMTLSTVNAEAAARLLALARQRRDAGDASTLEVELATLTAGRAAQDAATDSLAYASATLALQEAIGAPTDRIRWTPSDDVGAPREIPTLAAGLPAITRAAELDVAAARFGTLAARRTRFGGIAALTGIEFGDPSGSEPGILPVVGVSLPLPLWNRQRGQVALADAAEAAARATRDRLLLASAATVARTRRAYQVASAQLEQDGELLETAARLESMADLAYREGEATLVEVLATRQQAREIRALHLQHQADASVAAATLRWLGGLDEALP